jgi:hypothetical protein
MECEKKMLFDALFGNPTIEKILLFLLVNEKCYAAQIRHCLGGALTPIQQALNRLEKGKIVISELEGKTRVFRFNPHYAFLRELQALLKQGYHQLQLHDQHQYYCSREKRTPVASRTNLRKQKLPLPSSQDILGVLWERLRCVTHLSFSARSHQSNPLGWNGKGQASVKVDAPTPRSFIFQEQGVWTSEDGKPFDFKNCYRWTWNSAKLLISLEHLRHGADNPVFLFELTPFSDAQFKTVHPFLCRHDTYLATLTCRSDAIAFDWRILGPRKNEEIHYIYA